MKGKRILVMGGSGSGKSTLSRKLGEILCISVVHLDKLFWREGWVSAPLDEFDALIDEILSKDAWVMDGNYSRTLKKRLKHCEVILYLDYSRITCLFSVLKRICKSYGRTRPDMGEGCIERIDWDFLKFTWNFNKNFRAENLSLLEGIVDKQVYIFRNRKACRKFLEDLSGMREDPQNEQQED